MSEVKNKYKCYICGKLIGSSLQERIQHLEDKHKGFLKEKEIDIEKAVLIFTKKNDSSHKLIDLNKNKVKEDVRSRMNEIYLNKKYGNIAYYLKGLRGKEVSDLHTCSCCGKATTHNWEYQCPGNVVRYLCTKCHTQVKHYNGKTEIIYNPVATNRRRH